VVGGARGGHEAEQSGGEASGESVRDVRVAGFAMRVHAGKIILFAGTVDKARELADLVQYVAMALYSLLLMAVLALGAPYWLARMASGGRYRAGLGQRLGRVPAALRAAVAGRQVVWVHAVSVGEVLAATRLVAELEAGLGAGWIIVVSTTTATGQALARERFADERVFFYPLDFAWTVRGYLRALRPKMLVLMESELWPRMLVECGRKGIPVAVVNARVSDKSFARGVRLRAAWGKVLRRVDLFLAQSEEDARRLVEMGAREDAVKAIGNLKYDVRAPKASRVAELIREAAAGRPIVVAGSTVERVNDKSLSEDEMVIQAWEGKARHELGALLVLAPRHPERFRSVESVVMEFSYRRASDWGTERESAQSENEGLLEIVLLDTIGDLAAVYGIADVAFVGGSLVARGGHNPLEPAQFGVPVVMGRSYENFRDIVGKMQQEYALRGARDKDDLERVLIELLTDRDVAKAMGERGRQVFEAQSGATARAVDALVGLVKK
jgi:3-deoxy-D-manno-octulosonic-acid transferase